MSYDFTTYSHPHGGRSRHGGGGGGFGRGGGGGLPHGRKLSSSELQLLLLAALETRPAHGYELMRQLEQHSGGFYSPSPGMIYPALAYLEDADEVTAEADGNRKRYRIAPAGAQRLSANRDLVQSIMDGLARIGSRMDEVRDAYSGLHDSDPAAARELHEARGRLKQALSNKRGCSPQEASRIAAILDKAAAEILPSTPSKSERAPE